MNNKEITKKILKNYYRNLLIYLLLINSSFFISFLIFKKDKTNKDFSPYSPEIKKIKIGNGDTAKIGIISDFQLDSEYNEEIGKCFKDNLRRALKYFKKNNIDIIIIAGDTTHSGKRLDFYCIILYFIQFMI